MKFSKFLPAIVLTFFLLLVWEIVVRLSNISPIILPAPSVIFFAFINNWQIIASHALTTLTETVLGLVIAVILGVITAILIDMSSLIKKSVYPILIISQTIPMIALAPLLLIWFGFDLLPKVIVVVIYCFFPIAVATSDGLENIDNDLLLLLKSMNASKWKILYLVKFPGALPSFFSGLKIAATYSVAGAIVGEYVGAYQGLGIYMQEMANSHAVSLVFAGIAVTAILSLFLFATVILIEKLTLSWK